MKMQGNSLRGYLNTFPGVRSVKIKSKMVFLNTLSSTRPECFL